jgi:2-polyprenyl-6-methoxyphenol hydroxylase-like FAD-dependent oxidoreductase
MRQTRTEVLVVGAGPVGLWSALLLAESGIEVVLIDRESRTTARSYACALHPATLQLLERFGLAQSALERGNRVETVGFYEGIHRQAELHLSKVEGDYPFLLILPQSALEELLEQRLRSAGVSVRWNHRFEELKEGEESVAAVVEELEGTSTGYVVPHWETVVKRRTEAHAQFLIGADGHNSMVRPRASLEYKRLGQPETFAAVEFETPEQAAPEVRVVLDNNSVNVLWPLAEHQSRWTFQVVRSDAVGDFPEKDRRSSRVVDPTTDQRIRDYVQRMARQRAPWFTSTISKVNWCTEVSFEKGITTEFGTHRCWLVGDAAHQTGPVGVQSMNAGFAEAVELTAAVKRILRESAPMESLKSYGVQSHKQWEAVLALADGAKPKTKTDAWVTANSARLLPCLPGYGPDLASLAAQFGLMVA